MATPAGGQRTQRRANMFVDSAERIDPALLHIEPQTIQRRVATAPGMNASERDRTASNNSILNGSASNALASRAQSSASNCSTLNNSASGNAVSNNVASSNPAASKIQSQVATSGASSPSTVSLKSRRPITTVFLQGFAFLWLVPMGTLLFLNIRGHIIGPSAWCPFGHCFVNYFDTANDQGTIRRFDRNDHNLLGVLQLVAKVLEKWFEVIAASMVYLILMRIASRGEGLPIGYWTRSVEFSDILRSFEPLLWRVGYKQGCRHKHSLAIWSFMLLTVLLSILCNLMGPATAVLAIPTLQWLGTPSHGSMYFTHLESGSPPKSDGFTMQDLACSQANVSSQQWSCSEDSLAPQLYQLMAPATPVNHNYHRILLQAGTCSYDFNRSLTDPWFIWAPNRQAISNISQDLDIMSLIAAGYTGGCEYPFSDVKVDINCYDNSTYDIDQELWNSYLVYNNTQRIVLQRSGPIIGSALNVNALNSTPQWPTQPANINNMWVTNITAKKQIRCYPEYYPIWFPTFDTTNNYTRCIQVGEDWDSDTKRDTFLIQGRLDNQSHSNGTKRSLATSDVRVDIYSSSRAAFLPNGTIPETLPPACLAPGTIANNVEPSCDWETFFTTKPQSSVANLTSHSVTVEFSTSAGLSLVLDMTAYMNHTNYTYDSDAIGNFFNFIATQDLPSTGTVIPIDPAWILTAWSVDSGGTMTSDKPPATIITDWFYGDSSAYADDFLDFLLYPHYQALSLIDYREQPASALKDVQEPLLLQRSAGIYVWAYAISSRTAYLGITVVVLGIIVVVAQVILGSFHHLEHRSLTQMLIAALEHKPEEEFKNNGVAKTEVQAACVSFCVADAETSAGKIAFVAATQKPRSSC